MNQPKKNPRKDIAKLKESMASKQRCANETCWELMSDLTSEARYSVYIFIFTVYGSGTDLNILTFLNFLT